MKPLLLPAIVVLGLLSCATSGGNLYRDDGEHETLRDAAVRTSAEAAGAVEPLQDEAPWVREYYEGLDRRAAGRKGLGIISDPRGAEVYLDERHVGITPLLLPALPRGRYRLTLTKEGFYPYSTWIAHFSDYSVYSLSLARITGFLRVEVLPRNALITVGASAYDPGRVLELPVGRYAVRSRAFGFEERVDTVVIRERELTELSLSLSEARFAVSAFRLNRERFNPRNPGALGSIRVSFEVSSFGAGHAVVVNEDGEEVHRRVFERFTSWSQGLTWNGRRATGQLVPDGLYTLRLRGIGEGEGTVVEQEQVVRVDSSLVLAYRSLASGSAGLVYVPTPETLPVGSFQLSSLVFARGESDAAGTRVWVPVILGTRWGLGGPRAEELGTAPFRRWELDVQAGSIVGYESAGGPAARALPLFASAAVKTPLLSPGGKTGFAAALQAKLAYQGFYTDTLANATGLSIGTPASLRLGGVSLLLQPELALGPWRISYDPAGPNVAGLYPWMYARAGLLLDLGNLSAGASIAARTLPFTEGLGLDLPFQVAAELHWLIPRSSLFLSFVLAGELTPPGWYRLQGGAGLGLLH